MSQDAKTPIYDLLGGEPKLRSLVHRFYEIMETNPEVRPLREIHPENLKSSEEKLFFFLSGWLGGPQLFTEKFGHPRLRARHMPFKIGAKERDQWMLCMVQAFDDLHVQEPIRSELLQSLLNLADHMRNQEES